MFGLSASIINAGFSALTGFIFKSWSISNEIKAAERKHQLDAMVAVATANSKKVEQEISLLEAKAKYERTLSKVDPHRSIARRVLAYGLLLSFISVFGLAAYMGPEIVWFTVDKWVEEGTSYFFGLFSTADVHHTDIITVTGIPLEWLSSLSALLEVVVGFYFGGSLAKFNNPYIK